MKTETDAKWNDIEFEEVCKKELQARHDATSDLGAWSDWNLFKWFEQHGIMQGVTTLHEDASKLLDAARFFSKVREIAGIEEGHFICHSVNYIESHSCNSLNNHQS